MSGSADDLFDLSTELGRDLAAVDWAATALGTPDQWQGSLRNVVRLMLGSRFAMWMAWGPSLTFFCNDAYRRTTLGSKYPWALGKPADVVWAEIWPEIGPLIDSVLHERAATWSEDLLLFLERSGYSEETYHTFSYSPITDDNEVVGMLCVVSEETARVISERRMRIVRDLSSALAAASTPAEVYHAAARALSSDRRSLPFLLAYVFDEDATVAERVLTAGIDPTHPLAPATIPLHDAAAPWPARAAVTGHIGFVEELDERYTDVPTGAWDAPPTRGMVVPFVEAGAPTAFGFLAAGLNRYRALDADYRGFVQLVASQLAAAITRARAYEDERRRAEELAELDRAKTLFFTNVSHELRTPLTLLLGPASDALADTSEPLPAHQRTRLQVIERNAERLLKLVNTLLDFSRMQSGQAQGTFEPVDLATWTAEIAAMFESAVQRAGLDFVVDCPPLAEPVHVDREMWAKIVLNLVSNALKATFSGSIRVALQPSGAGVDLVVTDTGVGIPVHEQDKLFERFHRVSGARLRSHEGSGVGLALVAELAGLHGGTVSVESAAGRGSSFTVHLPAGTAHLAADRVSIAPTNATDAYALGVGYLAEADRWFGASPTDPVQAPEGTARVLVVDDNADMREYIGDLLSPHYRVHYAVDGVEALESARADPPDLVLSDVMMPRLDGFGLLDALRADPLTVHIPVVMLSARAGEEAAVVGLEAGADDYLAKPFSARELLARVRANLELDRVRRVHAELERNRELLAQAEELAHVGSWQVDLTDGGIQVSTEFARLFGRDRDELEAARFGEEVIRVRADEREAVSRALRRTAETGEPFDRELHIIRPDGVERLVRSRAVAIPGDDGAPRLMRGSVQDITEQRSAEQAVAARRAAEEAAAREHAIAEELQRNLLPARTPRGEDFDVAVYYAAGVEDTQVGGDWYDVIPLTGGRFALVIGDVMGRGVRAAAVMGQLRAMVRAYARLDLPVADLLGQLDLEVAALGGGTIVTCVYAVADPGEATLTYGNAGHVPPLLVPSDAAPRRLDGGDPPLGTGGYQGRVESVSWTPGSRLILYTDGLVEQRGGDLDASIDRLAKLVDRRDLLVEELPNHLVQAMLDEVLTDDVAVLVAEARRPGTRDAVSAITPTEASVGDARRMAAATLAGWHIGSERAGDVVLAVSELVTNTVRYGAAPVDLRLRRDGNRLVVEVSDAALAQPSLRRMTPGAPNGRGLHLVAALADSWGTRPSGNGKTVWCVFST